MGWDGAARAAARGDIVVIVDVLRFSSAVTRAVEQGAIVYPRAYGEDVETIAAELGAVLAAKSWDDQDRTFSLSPRSYANIEFGTRVVLPSPNGATCTLRASAAPRVFAGCLLNASAVAACVEREMSGSDVACTVLAAGERWPQPGADGELRFALEDHLGAGAIISAIDLTPSPEALACREAFRSTRDLIQETLLGCASGRELRAHGREQDVLDCARLDDSQAVPLLRNGAYHPSTLHPRPSTFHLPASSPPPRLHPH